MGRMTGGSLSLHGGGKQNASSTHLSTEFPEFSAFSATFQGKNGSLEIVGQRPEEVLCEDAGTVYPHNSTIVWADHSFLKLNVLDPPGNSRSHQDARLETAL